MLCLHIPQSSLGLINTLMIRDTLALPEWAGVRAASGGGRHAGGPEACSQRSGLIPLACPRVVNRTINDMITGGHPDRADSARRLS